MFSEFRRVEENTSNEQKCPLVLYAKPSNKRFIIPLQKKKLPGSWLLFFGKSIQRHPDSVCKEKEKMVFWLLFSNESIQNILILSATVAPFASAGIRPVVNRLNQDTTEYYALVFCAFSLPYMVK